MMATIRMVTRDDAAQILEIYEPIVLETPISFELAPPSIDEMCARIARVTAQYPWLVCEIDGAVAGYVYGSRWRERAAYQWSAEVTAYVHPGHQRAGIGRGLYTALFDVLTAQGYRMALGGIALPNPASVRLHESVGFTHVGVYRAVGYKFGVWHDVGWWQRPLHAPDPQPEPPIPIGHIVGASAWQAAIEHGLAQIRA